MPNKPMSNNVSSFINYMREEKRIYPDLEHISRKIYYPYAAKGYKRWKEYFKKYYNSDSRYIIRSIKSFFYKKLYI